MFATMSVPNFSFGFFCLRMPFAAPCYRCRPLNICVSSPVSVTNFALSLFRQGFASASPPAKIYVEPFSAVARLEKFYKLFLKF